MVNHCCAFNCSNASDVNPYLIFHSFPNAEKDKERRLKWIHATKRKDWQPGKSTKLCSAHFLPTDYDPPVISGNLRLKKTAVPSVFDYPELVLPKKVCERRSLIQITSDLIEPEEIEVISPVIEEPEIEVISPVKEEPKNEVISSVIEEPFHKSVSVQTNLTGIELTNTLNKLRREKKCLQQQLQRRNARILKPGRPRKPLQDLSPLTPNNEEEEITTTDNHKRHVSFAVDNEVKKFET